MTIASTANPLSNLLWFHAFRRPSVGEVIDVLRRGPRHNPDPDCTTRRNEAALGIPASSYAYLGKTVPDFGDVGFAFPFDDITGEMSPFDTGGLVEHIKPVSDRKVVEKRAFLDAYSFNTRFRKRLIADYPGASRNATLAYLRGERPNAHNGPHRVWPRAAVTDPGVAAIWNGGNSWQAWTWEARAPRRLPVNSVHRWSCSAVLFEKIRDYAETSAKQSDITFLESLIGTYVRGGVSRLVADLRMDQLP